MKKIVYQTPAKAVADGPDFFKTFRGSVSRGHPEPSDWRVIVRSMQQCDRHVVDVWGKSFNCVLEKHLALQAMAVLNGSYNYMLRWPYKPWDDPSSIEYELKASHRWPISYQNSLASQPIVGIIKLLDSTLKRIFRDKFSITALGRNNLEVSEKYFPPIGLDSEVLKRTLFSKLSPQLNLGGYQFFHSQGLGSKICFDADNARFYIDQDYFLKKPATHLFYPINLMMLAESFGYFAFLHLDPIKEIIPLFKAIFHSLNGKLENALVVDLDAISREQLLLLGIGDVTASDILKIKSLIWDELYKEQLCQSLDLIGLVESYFGVNVFDDTQLTILKLISRDKRIQMLLKHCTNIQLSQD